MIASQHNRPYFTIAYHFVELQRYLHTSCRILIKNTRLCTYHKIILFRVAYPIVVIQILTATIRINTFHRRMIGLYQIFMFTTETYPAERSVTVIKKFRPHNIFYITGEYKSILIIFFFGNLTNSGIINSFHKGVSIIEEIGPLLYKGFYSPEMACQRFIHQSTEFLRVFMQQTCTFGESNSHRTVSAFVNGMAGSLVRKQVYMYILVYSIFQQVNDIPMISNGYRFLAVHRLMRQQECFGNRVRDVPHPTLAMPGFNA